MSRRLLLLASIGVVVLSSLPFFLGRFTTPEELFFTDRDYIVAADKAVYFSMIEEARQGKILFQNLFTGEEQTPRFFAPVWLVLGHATRIMRISSIDAYEVGRMLAGVAFLFFLGSLLRFFFSSPKQQWGAFALVALSSGIGAWVFPYERTGLSASDIFWKMPTDLWISESNTFLTLSHSALFILAQGLLVGVFVFWYRWMHDRRRRDFLFLLLSTLLLGILHPYDILIILVVLFVSLLLQILIIPSYDPKRAERDVRGIVAVGFIGSLPLLFFLFTMAKEAALAGWMVQNVTISPPLLRYLFGFGLLLPFAVFGGMRAWGHRDERWILPLAWVMGAAFLLYAPVQFQRRFVNGLHIPLALLAAGGVVSLWRVMETPRVVRSAILWVAGTLLFFGTTVYLIAQQTFFVFERRPPIVVDRSVADGAFWLRDQTRDNDLILANGTYGNLLPALTGRRVWFGHGHQTVDMEAKRDVLTNWFFTESGDERAKQFFLRNEGITYLFWVGSDPHTRDFFPEKQPYLKEVFHQDRVAVYQVM